MAESGQSIPTHHQKRPADSAHLPKNIEMKTISASRAKWVLRKYLRSRIFFSRKILLFDRLYELVDESKLNIAPVSLGVGSDCDEKAFVGMGEVIKEHPQFLYGFCEGYDRRNLKHAWCFFINVNEQVRYVEPSTAEIFSPTTERIYHFIR